MPSRVGAVPADRQLCVARHLFEFPSWTRWPVVGLNGERRKRRAGAQRGAPVAPRVVARLLLGSSLDVRRSKAPRRRASWNRAAGGAIELGMAGAAKDARAAEQVQRAPRPVRAEVDSRLALLMRSPTGSGRGLMSVEWLNARKSGERQHRQFAGGVSGERGLGAKVFRRNHRRRDNEAEGCYSD